MINAKDINKNIFREYDIRGVYPKDLNKDVAYIIGKAYGTYIKKFNQKDCVIGYDNRYSSPEIAENLIEGITSTGTHVLNIGLVTTPMYYYACIKTNTPAGIMVTASHNPKDDNGFKMSFDERGNARGEMIKDFYNFLLKEDFDTGDGIVSFMDITDDYYDLLLSSIDMGSKNIKVVIDCGNGTTSLFAPEIFTFAGFTPIVLYGESDPDFPNHHPDPSVEENLRVLKFAVQNFDADVGIAFDGDGDRIGIVDEKGNVIPADKFMIIIIRDLIQKYENKKYLYDVKCSKALSDEIKKLGGEGECYRTGNSYTKARCKEGNFIFGGEYSGHVFFRDKFPGFDSAIYAGLRLIEILSKTDKKLSELLNGINNYYSTSELKFPSTDDRKFEVVSKIKEYAIEQNYSINDIDGVRVEFNDGWALVRCSNTGPNITARFEATTENRLKEIEDEFTKLIEQYNK